MRYYNVISRVRTEILRLARAKKQSVCINTRRISAFYNVSELMVRREIVKLADEQMIRLSGWDGNEIRPYSAWSTAEEFVNSSSGDGHLHVDLWDNL